MFEKIFEVSGIFQQKVEELEMLLSEKDTMMRGLMEQTAKGDDDHSKAYKEEIDRLTSLNSEFEVKFQEKTVELEALQASFSERDEAFKKLETQCKKYLLLIKKQKAQMQEQGDQGRAEDESTKALSDKLTQKEEECASLQQTVHDLSVELDTKAKQLEESQLALNVVNQTMDSISSQVSSTILISKPLLSSIFEGRHFTKHLI